MLALWQAGVVHVALGLRDFQLPYPLQIAEALVDRWDILLYDSLVYTGFEAVIGLLLGATAGFLCAWLFVSFPLLRAGALPIAAALNSVPIVAVGPDPGVLLRLRPPAQNA